MLDGEITSLAALPVAGLLAEQPVAELAPDFERFVAKAAELGVTENPIGLLSSLPLPVVPSYRPTDMGLVDVNRQVLIPALSSWNRMRRREMGKRAKVMVVGRFNTDFSMRTPRVPVKGETILGGPFSTGPGGKGANRQWQRRGSAQRCRWLSSWARMCLATRPRPTWKKKG